MADQDYQVNELPAAAGVDADDLLVLYRGILLNGLPTHSLQVAELFNEFIGQYVHVAYADSLDVEDDPVNFSLTLDADKRFISFLVTNTPTPTPVAADFTEWIEVGRGFLAHRENFDNPHEVHYDQLLDDSDAVLEVVSKAEAEAGTATNPRWWTAQRVKQAILALAETGGVGGTINDLRQVTERSGSWVNPLDETLARDWDNPTIYLSTSNPAVLPPLNETSGMRENLDRYERIHTAPPVLLVVLDSSSPGAVDLAIQDRLEELGFTVTLQTQTVAPPTAGTYALAVIAESVGGGLHADWSTNATPVLTGEAFQLTEMRLLDADTSAEDAETADSITIAASGHEAIGDLDDGSLAVYSSVSSYTHVAVTGLPSGAEVLAEKTADSTRAAVVTYESGASLTTGTAPARRAYSGVMFRADLWTDFGKELFDGLVYWVAGWDY